MISVVLLLLKKNWKYVVIALTISALCYTVYSKIKDIGYQEATAECVERMQKYNDKLDTLIVAVESSSASLAAKNIEDKESLRKDFAVILATIKNKPLYVIEQGKCKPSEDFVNIYNQVVDRVNVK